MVRFSKYFLYAVLFCVVFSRSLWGVTFIVTQTVDNGSGTVAGTLSKAIVDLNATVGTEPNEIIFDIPVSNPIIQLVGSSLPSIFNAVTIDGTNSNGAGGTVTIDGSGIPGFVNTGLFVSVGAEGSVVKNLTLQNFESTSGILFAIRVIVDGVTIEGCVLRGLVASDECYGIGDTTTGNTSFTNDLTVTNCVITGIESNIAAGIKAASMRTCTGNRFTDIEATSSFFGIFVASEDTASLPLCARNIFQNIATGEFRGINHISPVAATSFQAERYCNNVFDSITAQGIAVAFFIDTVPPLVGGEQQVSGNVINDITGKKVAGINIVQPWGGVICANTISDLRARGGMKHDNAYGIWLGKSIFNGESNTVSNMNVYGNVIGNFSVLGRGMGCGIVISGTNSIPNTILNNSIFNIKGLAIKYPDNAPTDGTVQLLSAQCQEGKVTISGILFPNFEGFAIDFLVQFFMSPSADPLEAKTFIGEVVLMSVVGPTPFSEMIFASSFPNLFITATATALPEGSVIQHNNTSVVSNALISCSSVTPGLCTFLMQPSPITPVCPTGVTCPTGIMGQ